MAGLAKTAIKVKKQKKHGNKSGRKTSIRPSQKKAVKNGRHQEKETPKAKHQKFVKKAVAAIPATLEGKIIEDEILAKDLPFGDLSGDCVDEEADDCVPDYLDDLSDAYELDDIEDELDDIEDVRPGEE